MNLLAPAMISALTYYCLSLAGTEIVHAHLMNACAIVH